MGSNPVVGDTNHKPTANSTVNPSEVGKQELRSNSEGTSTGHTLITAIPKLKCFTQYKDWKSLLLSLLVVVVVVDSNRRLWIGCHGLN